VRGFRDEVREEARFESGDRGVGDWVFWLVKGGHGAESFGPPILPSFLRGVGWVEDAGVDGGGDGGTKRLVLNGLGLT